MNTHRRKQRELPLVCAFVLRERACPARQEGAEPPHRHWAQGGVCHTCARLPYFAVVPSHTSNNTVTRG